MDRTLLNRLRLGAASLVTVAAWQIGGGATVASAQQAAPPGLFPSLGLSIDDNPQLAQAGGPPPPPGSPPGAPPEAAAAAPAAPTALTTPAMTGPLVANPNPIKFPAGPLDTIYVSGFASGLALVQSNPVVGDRTTQFDVSNGQVAIQKTDGLVQFYAQAGAYSLPALGTPYIHAGDAINDYFSALPVGYLKLAPTDAFSVEGGRLPTLIGAEYTFTFQNMNIERGLLWNQEPAISRGVQANYTAGPVALSASLNDGFYSGNYDWLTGSAAWTIDSANTLTVAGGGNFGRARTASLATPLAQNNGDIFNLIYTYSAAPWTITPYFQYAHTPDDAVVGLAHSASTYGAAVLVNYAFTDNFSLAGRAEGIGSTGSLADGAPNLLYGPGSSAWSLTLTPTYQQGIFFARADVSFVQAESITTGFAFGHSGTDSNQVRLLVEAGVIF